MLYTGDADLLETMIECFSRTLPLAKARVQHYYNYSGAFWPEYAIPIHLMWSYTTLLYLISYI
jgi:hypothetical protein